jgi:hypothetical protein
MPKPVRFAPSTGTCTLRTALIAPFLASPVVIAGATGMPVMPASASSTAVWAGAVTGCQVLPRWLLVASVADGLAG